MSSWQCQIPEFVQVLFSALIYEHDYAFLTTHYHGKVSRKMGNGEMKVAG